MIDISEHQNVPVGGLIFLFGMARAGTTWIGELFDSILTCPADTSRILGD